MDNRLVPEGHTDNSVGTQPVVRCSYLTALYDITDPGVPTRVVQSKYDGVMHILEVRQGQSSILRLVHMASLCAFGYWGNAGERETPDATTGEQR